MSPTSGEKDYEVDKRLALSPDYHCDASERLTERDVGALTPPSYAAERALVRKFDMRLIPTMFVLYLMCFIDRSNIGNARIAGLEHDLGLTGYQYYICLTIFYIFYTVVEVPSNLIAKKVGPHYWIPALVIAFGLISMLTAWVQNFAGLMIARIALGMAEGGVMCGVTHYLSRFYTRRELVFRIGIFVSASSLSGAFGGLLASGLLSIGHVGSVHGWRVIFLVEGILSMCAGALAIPFMSPDIERASWLTEEERALGVARIRAENVGTVKVVEATKKQLIKRGFLNINMVLMATIFLLTNISVQGISLFAPTIVRSLFPGRSTVQVQLHTVPPFIVAWVWSLLLAWISDRLDKRGYVMLCSIPLSVVGYALFVGTKNAETLYAATFLNAMGVFPIGPFALAWGTGNASPDTTRAVVSALIPSIGTLGAIIATWSYLPPDAKHNYRIGNSLNLGTTSLLFGLTVAGILYNRWENRQRAQGKRDYRLEGLSQAEQEVLGSKHPHFVYSI